LLIWFANRWRGREVDWKRFSLACIAEGTDIPRNKLPALIADLVAGGYIDKQRGDPTSRYRLGLAGCAASDPEVTRRVVTQGSPKEERSLEAKDNCSDSVEEKENASPDFKNEQGVSQREAALSAANNEPREGKGGAASSAGPLAADEQRAKRRNLLKTATRWVRWNLREDELLQALELLQRTELALNDWWGRPIADQRAFDVLMARVRRQPLEPQVSRAFYDEERGTQRTRRDAADRRTHAINSGGDPVPQRAYSGDAGEARDGLRAIAEVLHRQFAAEQKARRAARAERRPRPGSAP
jgi:hypothetical protein